MLNVALAVDWFGVLAITTTLVGAGAVPNRSAVRWLRESGNAGMDHRWRTTHAAGSDAGLPSELERVWCRTAQRTEGVQVLADRGSTVVQWKKLYTRAVHRSTSILIEPIRRG